MPQLRFALLVLGVWLLGTAAHAQTDTIDTRLEKLDALEAELATLEQAVQRLEDVKAIKRLQRAYGYYLDKRLSGELTALFADAPGTSLICAELSQIQRKTLNCWTEQ